MARAPLSQSIICYIADCLIDFTLNWPFVTQDTRHERGTSISSIQFWLLLNHLIYDWLTGRKRIAEADGTVTLHYYIGIINADTRPMVPVSKLTEGRFGNVPLWKGQAFVLSSFPPEENWPLMSTEACQNASSAGFPVRLALFHFTKKIIILTLSPTFSNLFPIINETRMADIPSTDQHHKPY